MQTLESVPPRSGAKRSKAVRPPGPRERVLVVPLRGGGQRGSPEDSDDVPLRPGRAAGQRGMI